ncbi:MAG: hypothetical protein V7636_2946 [Actinomycetota bacterium]
MMCMAPALAVLGALLVATAGALAMAASGGLAERMPTQIPPRRFARYPLVAGVALLVIAFAIWLLP